MIIDLPHDEFVKAYRNGYAIVKVNIINSQTLLRTRWMPARYRAAYYFWTFGWFFSLPIAIACFIWIKWWAGLAVLLFGIGLPRAIRQSAVNFVIEQALENSEFYNIVKKTKTLIVTQR